MSVVVAAAAVREAPRDEASGAMQRPGPSILAVLAAMAAVVLDAGTATVALPTLASALRATPAQAIWIVTAYQTGLVMALLPCGALGERFGHRRVFGAGLALFAAGALASACSPSLAWLLAARIVQGLGGAAVMALGVALLRFTVPRERLGTAIGWNALTVALASAAAPSVGAAVIALADWRLIFVAALPLAGGALLAARALPDTPRTPHALDAAGALLNAATFALLVLAAQVLPSRPALAATLLAAAVLVAIVLFRRELPRPRPLVPVDLLRERSFRLSVLASVCCFAGQTSALVALPFHLQHAFGRSALITGLYVTAWPAAVAATAVVAGWLADRVSTAVLCAIGGALLAVGLGLAASWPGGATPLALVPCIALCGVGFGLFQTPNNRNLFLSAPAHRSGAAGGMQGTARVSGQTLGASLAALCFALLPLATASRTALWAAAVLALLAAATSFERRSA